MKPETKRCRDIFAIQTKVWPITARLGVGSMRGTITITVPYKPEICEFIKNENYYQKKIQNFKGFEIKFLGNTFLDEEYHQKHGYEFILELSEFEKFNP